MKGRLLFEGFSVNCRADYDAEAIKEKRLVYDLTVLEPLRAKIMEPLNQLFKAGPQSGVALLEKFMAFWRQLSFLKIWKKCLEI